MPPDVESLLQQNLPALRAFVRLRCNPALRARESTSDLVQSVCRELLVALPRLEDRDEPGFRRWLFVKALDKVRDRYRHHLAQKRDLRREEAARSSTGDTSYGEAYATMLTPSRIAIGREQMERIERAFDELPEQYREVITLSRLVGLGNAEIAEQLGVGVKQVSNALFRGLRKLSWILTDEADGLEARP
jgi:RNA polymerase sigma factor (sigma-70 family)